MITYPEMQGRRCVVIGSAPGVKLPTETCNDYLIAANGGVNAAKNRYIDLLVTTSFLFRENNTRAEQRTIEMMSYSHIGSACVYESAPLTGYYNWVSEDIRLVLWNTTTSFKHAYRDEVVTKALGTGIHTRVSTGVWAVCLALVSGAAEVVITGVGLSNGHSNIPWDKAARDHVIEDRQALTRILDMPNITYIEGPQ